MHCCRDAVLTSLPCGLSQVDKTQLMDVLKEEPTFSHTHFSEVKAASSGQGEPAQEKDPSGASQLPPTNRVLFLGCLYHSCANAHACKCLQQAMHLPAVSAMVVTQTGRLMLVTILVAVVIL